MRTPLYSLLAVLAFVPSLTHGQSAPCPEQTGVTVSYGLTSTKNAPFSGTIRDTFEQHLYDGNVIHTETVEHQARDTAGRTREERQTGCVLGLDGQMHPRIMITINDPVVKESINWTINDPLRPKVATVTHYQQLPPRISPSAPPTPEELALNADRQRFAQLQEQKRRKELSTERLGSRSFFGVDANGTRTTQTIPAGQEGNDLPLVVVVETWRSPKLQLTMYGVRDDPRQGRSTFEYTDFTSGEPDASLFSPPSDYAIRENDQGTGMVGFVLEGTAPPPPAR